MIAINNISKSFGNIQALSNVSFNVDAGEIYGLLGPNGAGKSTAINILNTLIKPDSGKVFINNKNIIGDSQSLKLDIGVVPQEIALYEDLSAIDNLMFWASLYAVPKSDIKKIARDTLDMVGLLDRANDPVKTYSGGMKRRINIASSIMHKPKVLLMDEPTVGVDPQSRNHIFDLVERLNSDGMTIIYTTHYMEEVERLCDRVAILDMGSVIAQGSIQDLRIHSGVRDQLTIRMSNMEESMIATLKNSIPTLEVYASDKLISVSCDDIGLEISEIINKVKNAGGIIDSVDTNKANLESMFLKLTGKQLRD